MQKISTEAQASHTIDIDIDTVPSSSSTKLKELQKKIVHSPLPSEAILSAALKQSGELQRTQAGPSTEPELTPERLASIEAVPPHPPVSAAKADDTMLVQCMQRHVREDKNPHFNHELLLAFAKESHLQHSKPESQQDWTKGIAQWRKLVFDRLEGRDQKRGDVKASQLYVTPSTILSVLPLLSQFQTLATNVHDLKEHAVQNANIALGLQSSTLMLSPLLQATARMFVLPLSEGAREIIPMRSKEMRTRSIDAIVGDMQTHAKEIMALKTALEADKTTLHQLTQAGHRPPPEQVESVIEKQGQMITHSEQVERLLKEYVAKKGTDRLNDVFTFWRTFTGMWSVGTSLTAAVVGVYFKDAHLAAAIQIGGMTAGQLANQGLTAPVHAIFGKGKPPKLLTGAATSDDALKQDATFDTTAMTTNIVVEAARSKAPDDITLADIDTSDLAKQVKGPIGVAVSQLTEIFDFNIKIKEQQIDALLGLQVGEFKKGETLSSMDPADMTDKQREYLASIEDRMKILGPTSPEQLKKEKFLAERDTIRQHKDGVKKAEEWDKLPDDIKNMLHDALGNNGVKGTMRHAVRVGMVRLAQPSDFIPQVVQVMATSMQLFLVAGRAFPMLLNQVFRRVNAPYVERGEQPPITNAVRYASSVFAMAVGVLAVMSQADQIRKKIAQRGELRKHAAEHGEKFGIMQNFMPRKLALGALLFFHAMMVCVTGRLDRYKAQRAYNNLMKEIAEGNQVSSELQQEIDAIEAAQMAAMQEQPQTMALYQPEQQKRPQPESSSKTNA